VFRRGRGGLEVVRRQLSAFDGAEELGSRELLRSSVSRYVGKDIFSVMLSEDDGV